MRIVQTCRELGVGTVAIHSRTDSNSRAVQLADASVCVGRTQTEHRSQPQVPAIITAALLTGADAIHPGYGPLCEDEYFAGVCADYKISLIGVGLDGLERLRSKAAVKEMMQRAGLPVVPGVARAIDSFKEAADFAQQLGYPVALSLDADRGERFTAIAEGREELESAHHRAQQLALRFAMDRRVFIESVVRPCRRINVPVLCDSYAHGVHLGEIECLAYERGHVLVAESPCTHLRPGQRRRMCELALQAAVEARCVGPGTVQFLIDTDGNFYFHKLSARLTVEHPITEVTTDIDLTREQIRVAVAERISFTQENIRSRRHAIGCHIHAVEREEASARRETIDTFIPANGPGVRVDTHIYPGWRQPVFYEPLLAKMTVLAHDRRSAVDRMSRALSETVVQGVRTNIPFHRSLLSREPFTSDSQRLRPCGATQ